VRGCWKDIRYWNQHYYPSRWYEIVRFIDYCCVNNINCYSYCCQSTDNIKTYSKIKLAIIKCEIEKVALTHQQFLFYVLFFCITLQKLIKLNKSFQKYLRIYKFLILTEFLVIQDQGKVLNRELRITFYMRKCWSLMGEFVKGMVLSWFKLLWNIDGRDLLIKGLNTRVPSSNYINFMKSNVYIESFVSSLNHINNKILWLLVT